MKITVNRDITIYMKANLRFYENESDIFNLKTLKIIHTQMGVCYSYTAKMFLSLDIFFFFEK